MKESYLKARHSFIGQLEYKFVDERGTVYTGLDASCRLQEECDEIFMSPEGIINVDHGRWQRAQRYELSEWVQRGSHLRDDRNYFHKEVFDSYQVLNTLKTPRSFIELGCGPFTNARVILEQFPGIEDITLVDPLADQYMNLHRNCTYRESRLNVGEGIRPVKVVSTSIEELEVDRKYDIVVMVNVLEHCFDIPVILDKINNLLSDNGCFIYADVQFDKDVIDRLAKTKYNAGHPIRFTKEYMNNYLNINFEELYSKFIPEVVAGEPCEEHYFIGKKTTWGGSGMVRECAEWIIDNIPYQGTVLEIGAGKISTRFLSQNWEVYSVEQDSTWVDLYDGVNYIHAPLVDGWYSPGCLKQLPLNYELLIIDGPVGGDRSKILEHLNLFNIQDTTIIVDDTYRETERFIVNELLKLGKKIVLEGVEGNVPQFTVLK